MGCRVRLIEEHTIIEGTLSGVVAPEELRAGVSQALTLAKRVGSNLFLTDCSDLEGGHSIVDLYFLADQLIAMDFDRAQYREAIVLPAGTSEIASNVKFWEDTCFNRGYKVEGFSDRASAIAWLLQSRP